MDTNLMALLVAALQESRHAVTAAPDNAPGQTVVVVGLILAAVSPVLAAVATYYAKKVATVVEKVHVAVNSERSEMLKTVKDLRDEILRITKERTILEEQKRERVDRDMRQVERKEQVPQPQPVVASDNNPVLVRLESLLAKYEAPLVVSVKK